MPSSGFELPSALATVLLFPACWFQHIREPADCDFKAVFIIWGLNYIFSPQAHIYCLSSGTRMPNYRICRFKSKPVFERALLISAEFLWCLLSVSNVSWIKLIWTDVLAFAGPSFSIAIKSDDSSVYPWETAKMECSLSVSGSSPKTGTVHTHTHTHSIYGGTVCEVFSRALINHDLQLLQALFIFFHACIETLLQLPHVQIHTNVSFAFFTCQPVSSSLNKNDVMIKSSAFVLLPLWFYIRGLVTWCTVVTFLSRLLSLM